MLVTCKVTEESLKTLNDNGVTTNTSMIEKNSSGLHMIPHMLVLVKNDDGTFSFDDITYAIFNRGTEKEKDFFNYNYQAALKNKQTDLEGFDTYILRAIIEHSKDTKSDEIFRENYKKSKRARISNHSV